jgi:uncharacterized membrane protein
MFWLLGLIGGIVVGAIFWDVEGAILLGFGGFIAGIIIGANRKSKARDGAAVQAPVVARAPAVAQAIEATQLQRMQHIEARLAEVESRLATLDGQSVPSAAVTALVEPVAMDAPAGPVAQAYEEAATIAARVPAADVQEIAPPPEATVPKVPPPPAKPNPIVAWFLGGNTIVRVGLVILFVGLAFLIKYAADNSMLPVELRVAGVAAAGIALLFVGWRLRDSRRNYALSLQGAGVAVLYLTFLGAMRLYHLIPPEAAFFMLAAIAVFCAILAVKQDALALAVIGAGGGFLAPILVSTGGGSHITLFSYYLVLNAGILAIALFKAWRPLNLVGFVFTLLIGFAWGERSYQPEFFASVEFFLAAFFLLFVAIALLFTRHAATEAGRLVDGTIVFGVPIAAFGLQAGLTRGMEFGLAWSSLGLGAFYLGLATILIRLPQARWKLLTECFLALGLVFASLAIPLALDARWTSAAWALEGAAIFWIGVRQRRLLARAFAVLLQTGAGISFFLALPAIEAQTPLVDAAFVGSMLVALAGLWTHRLLATAEEGVLAKLEESALRPMAFLWGYAWLLFGVGHEIGDFVASHEQVGAMVAAVSLVASLFAYLQRRWAWREGAWPFLALMPMLVILALLQVFDVHHPLGGFGWFAWPVAFVAHTIMLYKIGAPEPARWPNAQHTGAYLLLAFLGTWELHWMAEKATASHTAWSAAALLVVPALLVFWAANAKARERWPLEPFARAYRNLGAMTLLVAMAVWSLLLNLFHDGSSDPLPYLPILNAIDLGHILAILAGVALWLAARRGDPPLPEWTESKGTRVVLAGLVFLWLNAILLRSIHHWVGVPYIPHVLWDSFLVQASLSVFWSLLALATMVFATRRGQRALWTVGAALMAVVVAKLLLVDLSRTAGITRIISFVGVGVLMLVIGYFSPIPPKAKENAP